MSQDGYKYQIIKISCIAVRMSELSYKWKGFLLFLLFLLFFLFQGFVLLRPINNSRTCKLTELTVVLYLV